MKSKFLSDFKDFAMRGNVLDMAVGVIIGGAFGKIVSSLVNDILMPVLGKIIGGIDFTSLKYVLSKATVDDTGKEIPEVVINYGTFIQNTIDFLIIAFSIFVFIKMITRLTKKKEEAPQEPAAPPAPTKEEELLSEIRDLLKDKKN